VMKRPSFSVNVEETYDYGDALMRHLIRPLFDDDGRDSLNSCFGAVSHGIRKVLIIYGRLNLLKSEEKLKKRLNKSIKKERRDVEENGISISS
jgi:hypothetical protein